MKKVKILLSILIFTFIVLSSILNCSIANVPESKTANAPQKEETNIERENVWGEDSVKAIRCHLRYRDDLQFGNVIEAYPYWRCNYKYAPASTLHIYVDGVRILREMINNAELDAEKEAFIDTLMTLYDDRIAYFGNEGYVMGRKGLDLIRLRPAEFETAFKLLDKSIELQVYETEFTIPQTYMMILSRLFRSEEIKKNEFIKKYLNLIDIINYNINSAENFTENWIQTRDHVQQIVSRVLDCEDLLEIYNIQYNSAKKDIENLKTILNALENSRCTENELYQKIAFELFKLEPNAKLAGGIAAVLLAGNKNAEAISYYTKAIELENDNDNIAQYYMQIASIYRNMKNFSRAKDAVLNAIKHKPEWGLPHLFLGNLYIVGAEDCVKEDEFIIHFIYILAVSKYQYAKNIDPSVAKEADELIERYKKHFPDRGKAFFRGYEEGDTITIDCWINETIKVVFKQ